MYASSIVSQSDDRFAEVPALEHVDERLALVDALGDVLLDPVPHAENEPGRALRARAEGKRIAGTHLISPDLTRPGMTRSNSVVSWFETMKPVAPFHPR